MKIAFALSGGGVRSAAQLGIVKALYEKGLDKATIFAGTSGGSIAATLLALGNSPDEALEKFSKTHDVIDIAYWHIIKSLFKRKLPMGFIKGKKLEDTLSEVFERKLVSDITKCGNLLAYVSTDIQTGRQIIFTNAKQVNRDLINDSSFSLVQSAFNPLSSTVVASCSLPSLFIPKMYANYKLVDGGIVNNLPTDVANALGADRVISIDLGYMGGKESVNSVLGVASQSIDIMMERTTYENNNGQSEIYLNPGIFDVGLLDTGASKECFDRGYQYGLRVADQVIKAVKEGVKIEV